MSDFQAIVEFFQNRDLADSIEEDGIKFFSAKNYANYLCILQIILAEWTYYRRRRMDPLMNTSLVAGFDNAGNKYLAFVDMYGTLLESDFALGGMAQYFCQVLLTNESKPDMTEDQARTILDKCMRVLMYRDSRAAEHIQFCTITAKGVTIEAHLEIKSDWSSKQFVNNTNEKIHNIKTE